MTLLYIKLETYLGYITTVITCHLPKYTHSQFTQPRLPTVPKYPATNGHTYAGEAVPARSACASHKMTCIPSALAQGSASADGVLVVLYLSGANHSYVWLCVYECPYECPCEHGTPCMETTNVGRNGPYMYKGIRTCFMFDTIRSEHH